MHQQMDAKCHKLGTHAIVLIMHEQRRRPPLTKAWVMFFFCRDEMPLEIECGLPHDSKN